MKHALLLLGFAFAFPAAADVVAATSRGVVVAHHGVVELRNAGRTVWSAPGVDQPAGIVAGGTRMAILDAWTNRARIISMADGLGMTITTAETPIAGVFVEDDLYLIARDSNQIERIAGDGSRQSVPLSPDPAFIGAGGNMIYVYSRVKGVLQEITAGHSRMRVSRELALPPFASDMEIDGRTAYLIYPRAAQMVAADLDRFEIVRSVSVGGAPTDLSVSRRGNALSPPLIAVADPSAKRVWLTEGAQSVGAAFGRGFLRGLLGLGLFRPSGAGFPRGIDRVIAREGTTLAYDSTSGTLYRADRGRSATVAEDVDPQGFTIADGRIVYWRDGTLHEAPLTVRPLQK